VGKSRDVRYGMIESDEHHRNIVRGAFMSSFGAGRPINSGIFRSAVRQQNSELM